MAESAKSSDQFSLINKRVLAQTPLGIFYGFLEKSDTRIGTALLSYAYMLSPKKHITYLQYLDAVNFNIDTIIKNLADTEHKIDYDDENGIKTSLDKNLKYRDKIRKEIGASHFGIDGSVPISEEKFSHLAGQASIIDFATEGVALVFNEFNRWSDIEEPREGSLQDYGEHPIEERAETPDDIFNGNHAKLISLTGVQAIVPVAIDSEIICVSPVDYSEETILVSSTFAHIGPNSMLQVNTPKLELQNDGDR